MAKKKVEMSVTVSRAELNSIKKILINLRNSCLEGLSGTWDCSSDEGRESFQPMAESCEEIAKLLNIFLD